MRSASGESFCIRFLRRASCARRRSSATSGATSTCSTSAPCSWPSSRISSSCVGASSPNRAIAASHSSCTLRMPSIRPMTKCAGGLKRCMRRETRSSSTYQRSPRYWCRWMRTWPRRRGRRLATRYQEALYSSSLKAAWPRSRAVRGPPGYGSRSRPACARRPRSCRRPPCPDAGAPAAYRGAPRRGSGCGRLSPRSPR